MGQKKENNGGEKKKKNNGGEAEKKGGDGVITAVSKMDMHREGCASKMKKCVRRFEDLEKPRGMVESKGKKKVELVPPLPKDKKKGGGGGGKGQKGEGKRQKEAAVKMPQKQPTVTTAEMELDLHCPRSVKKIKEIITHTKGYLDMYIDKQKNRIMVAGTMNMEALADALKNELQKPVKIVPSKKGGGGN